MAPAALLRALLAFGLLAAPFAGACGGGDSTNAGGSGTSSTSSTTSTSAPVCDPIPDGTKDWQGCHTCQATKCQAEIEACDDECIAIQACLDAVCYQLSATGSSQEAACQVYCQDLHAGAKAKHLAVVNCAQLTAGSAGECAPPCAGYSYDWDQCRAFVDECACKPALDACLADQDCIEYKVCANTCATAVDCIACGSGTAGAKGRALYEGYWGCVETSCLVQAWIPNF